MDRRSDDIHALDERELAAHALFLRRVARRLVRDDEQRAEDVAQETWRLALAKPPTRVRSWRGWLATAAGNVTRQLARGAKRRDRHEQRAAAREAMPSAAEVAARLETERRLIDAVAALDEGDRALVLLRHFDGLAPREIARRMKLPVETVKTRLKRALERLRARLVERAGDRDRLHSGLLLVANGLVAKVGVAGGLMAGGIVLSLKGKVVAAAAVVAMVALTLRFGGPWAGRGGGSQRDAERPAAAAAATTKPVERDGSDPSDGATRVAEAAVPVAATATPVVADDPTAIFGRFVDASGRPIEGVEVCSDGWGREWPLQRRHASGWPSTKSDEGGRFLWRRASAQGLGDAVTGWSEPVSESCGWADALIVHLVAWRPGHVRSGWDLNGVAGQAMDVGDLVLEREVRIAGAVVVPEGVDPTTATIEIEDASHQAPERMAPTLEPLEECVARTRADARGHFEFGALSAGKFRLWASLPGSLHTPSDVVQFVAGKSLEELAIRIEMPRTSGELLQIAVERPDGSPMAGALVGVEFREPRRTFALPFVADGAGRVDVPTYGREVRGVVAEDPDGRLLRAVRHFAGRLESPCVLRLGESFELTVEVASADAAPLLPVEVEALVVGEGADRESGTRFQANDEGSGRVVLRLPDGMVELRARTEGFDETAVGPLRVRDATTPIRIALAPQPALSGRVLAEGRPVAGAMVSICEERDGGCIVHGAPSRAMFTGVTPRRPTDAQGRFRVVWRYGGCIYVHAHAEGFASATVGPFEMKEDEAMSAIDDIEIDLKHGGSLVGTVVPGGDGAIARHVVLSNGDGAPRSWPVAPDGSFRVDHLTPGPWNVRVNDAPISFLSMNVKILSGSVPPVIPSNCVIRDGETTTITLTGDDTLAGVVRGSVDGLAGAASRWSAWIGPEETPTGDVVEGKPGAPQPVSLAREGRFELRSDESGRSCKIVLWPCLDDTSAESWCTWSEPFDLRQGLQSWHANLSFGRIDGDVGAIAAGRPLTIEADATTIDGLQFHASVPLDAAGRFVIAAAPAGEVRLRVPETEIARSVTVVAGETATVQFR